MRAKYKFLHRTIPIDGGNTVVPISTNVAYQSNTNEVIAPNPLYVKGSDIHIYDEIPRNQYKEPIATRETTLNDQDNGSYASQGNQQC